MRISRKEESTINTFSMNDELKETIAKTIVGSVQKEYGFKLTLSAKQAAKVLGVNHLKIYELCRTDNFPCLKMGNRIIIPVIQFLDWIDKESWSKVS